MNGSWQATKWPLMRLRTEGDADFKRADKEFFRALWTGVSSDPSPLIALVQPHIDRPFEQVSPIERSIILIGAWSCNRASTSPTASRSTSPSNWPRHLAALTGTNGSTACSTSWPRRCGPMRSPPRPPGRHVKSDVSAPIGSARDDRV